MRQGSRSDRGMLLRGFDQLSDESRYRRFLAPMQELTGAMVRYLTEVDHHDHESIIAIDDKTGEGIGVARYVRDDGRPEAAELAVTVVDGWQRRGVGTLLVEVIAARARQEGITSFTAVMLATNHEMLELLEHLGPIQVVERGSGTIEIDVPIPEVGLSPALRRVLRVAARRDAAVPLASRLASTSS